jgi:hypothetical protein
MLLVYNKCILIGWLFVRALVRSSKTPLVVLYIGGIGSKMLCYNFNFRDSDIILGTNYQSYRGSPISARFGYYRVSLMYHFHVSNEHQLGCFVHTPVGAVYAFGLL